MLDRYLKALTFVMLCLTGSQFYAMAPAPAVIAAAQQKVCAVCAAEEAEAFPRLACGHQECCAECLAATTKVAIADKVVSNMRCPHRKLLRNGHYRTCRHELTDAEIAALPGGDELMKGVVALKKELHDAETTAYQKRKNEARQAVEAAADALGVKNDILCPACFESWKKTEGCNHLTCPNPICRYEFCEQCLRPYWSTGGHKPNPEGHGMHGCRRDVYAGPPIKEDNKEIDGLNRRLLQAVRDNNLEQVNDVLARDANPDVLDRGTAPLMIAAVMGHVGIVKSLLDYDAIIDLEGNSGFTALQWAATRGYVEIVRILLAAGANINHINHRGETALTLAITSQHTTTAHLLIEHGANINLNGDTALIQAAEHGRIITALRLIEYGADVNHPDLNGDTALIRAAQNGHTDAARLLIEHGANVNLQNHFGNTALMIAAKNDRTHTARLLIERGANINLQNNYGDTALILTIERGHTDTAQLLIEHNATVNLQNNNGNTALMLASTQNSIIYITALIINHNANVNLQNRFGETALICAAANGNTETVRTLIERGANINHQNNNGDTALMLAINGGHVVTVQLLTLNYGALQNRALLWINNHRLATATIATAAVAATGYALWKYFRK